MSKKDIMLHKLEERLIFNKVLDQIFLCEKDFKPKFTDFIPLPKAEGIINILQKKYSLAFSTFGGIEGVQRVQIGICHAKTEITEKDYPIQPIEIIFGKFKKEISHRSVLGSILGLGIERGKVGDILVFEDRCVVFLDSQIAANFALNNLTHIGNSKIRTAKVDMSTVFVPLENYKKVTIKLENMRLSSLVAKGFNVSRDVGTKLIKAKKVTVNWSSQTKDSAKIEEGDTVSVRGYGKIVVKEVENNSVSLHIYK
ncbi:MAG: YlmH/Sll1252 family protein [Defluviitaleaceae bacterium]|nr:YlmH/Sll1252 family protein [Defluviitaleaceae bacterium]